MVSARRPCGGPPSRRASGWAYSGDHQQKVDPYLRPLYDALYDLMGFDKTAKLFERNTIEIAPLAYMRVVP